MNWKKIVRYSIFTLIVLAILLLDLYYYYPAALPPAVSGHTLKTAVSFSQVFGEPNGSNLVTFGVTVFNGIPPYAFVATWSDNYTQQNNLGTFARIFQKYQYIPARAYVTITDSDHETSIVNITIYGSSLTTNTTSQTTSEANSLSNYTTTKQSSGVIKFVESGLPPGQSWSVSIDGKMITSISNETVFIGPFGNYNYSISYAYHNITTVYSITPTGGTIKFNNTVTIVNINFSRIPTNEIFKIVGTPSVKIVNGFLSVNATFSSILPVRENGVVFGKLYNSAGQAIDETSSAISINSRNSTTVTLFFTRSPSGPFVIRLTAYAIDGTQISNTTAVS